MTKSQHLRKPESGPRHHPGPDGKYVFHGRKYAKNRGSREEVRKRIAYITGGGLTYKDIVESTNVNHKGKLVSVRKRRESKVASNLREYNRSRRRRR